MKRSITGWILVFICLVSASAQVYKKNRTRIIVQFHLSSFSQYISSSIDSISPQPVLISQIVRDEIIDKLKKRFNQHYTNTVNKLKDLVLFHYENLPELEMNRVLSELNSDPLVEYAEPDYKIRAMHKPSDTHYMRQWNMVRIGMEQVWDYSRGSQDVIVAVLDTGVDYTHPDLFQSLIPGYDFCNGDDDPYDDAYDSYHGTHVAGIIASRGNNNQGIAGVAWNVKVMPLKILDQDEEGRLSVAIEAIKHAVAEGAHIINMSWGKEEKSQTLKNAIQCAWAANQVIFVAGAGNGGDDLKGDDNDDSPFYPASYDLDYIISVASTDDSESDEKLSIFSNYGANSVDLAAPGTRIYSTKGQNKYQSESGTSMAAPHVSGAAAIIKSVYPDLQSSEIISAIINKAEPLVSLKGKVKSGGRLNVYNALVSFNRPLPTNTPESETPPLPTPEPITDLLLMYQCGEALIITSNIKVNIRIMSRDTKEIALSDVTLKYYYTKDGDSTEKVVIDRASIRKSDIIATPEDGYIHIGFTEDAGILEEYNSVDLHLRFYKNDYTNYDQSDDYSFDPMVNNDYYRKITMYVDEDKIWGYEPGSLLPTPEPTPVILPGDVNNSRSIDIIDALLVAQYYVGLDPQPFCPSAADVNCDMVVDIIDALLISQYYIGLITRIC